MPASYAHKMFGATVYKSLPADTKRLIHQNLPYFLIGLHGPDLLFFHHSGVHSHVEAFGRRLHHERFQEFYENAREVITRTEDDKALVYFYGVICHLYMDSMCHPFINSFSDEVGVSHGKLEQEYERHLLRRDGKAELTYPVTAHVGISQEYARVIAPFYLGVSEGEILECLICMRVTHSVARLGDPISRKVISKTMTMAGFENKVASMLMSKEESRLCKPGMKQIDALAKDAALLAREAIESLGSIIYRDKLPDYAELKYSGK